jgi:hypothetical protein
MMVVGMELEMVFSQALDSVGWERNSRIAKTIVSNSASTTFAAKNSKMRRD